MSREILDSKVKELLDDVIVLGSMVEQMTLDAVQALKRYDLVAARRTYQYDERVNEMRFQIEERTMSLIATQGPVARDMRLLASVMEIATELERMGDYAKGIARICIMLSEKSPANLIEVLPQMAEVATGMLHRALGAFVTQDVEQARDIPIDDEIVDELYNQMNHTLISHMIAHPNSIDQTNYLIWAAHNLERMADRVTNICERTIYTVTGDLVEIHASDDEIEIEKS